MNPSPPVTNICPLLMMPVFLVLAERTTATSPGSLNPEQNTRDLCSMCVVNFTCLNEEIRGWGYWREDLIKITSSLCLS
jgi:hypothetical protein